MTKGCVLKFSKALSGEITKRGRICKKGERDTVYNKKRNVEYFLYNTNIATGYKKNNRINLNTGGYETKTTKDRMNEIISGRGCQIRQKKYQWYIGNRKFPDTGKVTVKENCDL